MSEQPKALRLADWLDADACDLKTPREAAAELRRLHEVNAELERVLLKVARMAEALKKDCGMDPESKQAIRNGEYMNISYVARDAITKGEQK
jgi:hypothetical protein